MAVNFLVSDKAAVFVDFGSLHVKDSDDKGESNGRRKHCETHFFLLFIFFFSPYPGNPELPEESE